MFFNARFYFNDIIQLVILMKAVGIIAEYNPFHNGHIYQIQEIQKRFPGYPIIVVMSGNFTERGDPAIVNKWHRTKIALQNGVDLTVELPFPFATASADLFAHGAIAILKELQISHLVFGSESNNLENLQKVAKIQIHNEQFEQKIKSMMKTGLSYPKVLANVIEEMTGLQITNPNDILAISYIKEILLQQSNIIPVPIKRTNSYHSKILSDNHIASATSIRHAIENKIDVNSFIPIGSLNNCTLHLKEEYFNYLKYQIYASWNSLESFHGMDKNLVKKIKKEIANVKTIDELIQKIKTKNYTYQRLSRTLLYILCGYKKELAKQFQDPSYIRILGFTDKGKNYLHLIKKNVSLPILSHYKDTNNAMLTFESQVSNIYQINKSVQKQEYQEKPIYIKEIL